jgi:hypothetical protein
MSESDDDAMRDVAAAVAALLRDDQEGVDVIVSQWNADRAALVLLTYLATSVMFAATVMGQTPVQAWDAVQQLAISITSEDDG